MMVKKESANQVIKVVFSVAGAILAIIASLALTGASTSAGARDMLKGVIEESIGPRLEAIEEKLNMVQEFQLRAVVLSIQKQAEKIRKDPDDIKLSDVAAVLQDYKRLPESMITEDVKAMIEVITIWYKEHLV